MKNICQNNRRECDKNYDFSKEGIFVWTKETCLGDEVFYSFLEARGLHEEFLSSFCKERTEQYRYCCQQSASFLSEDTFISCFFAWISNWDIDFRAPSSIDPFCGHNPQVLACDGVHVGVAVRFMSKCVPITKSQKPDIKPIGTRRFDRVLLPGNTDADRKRRKYVRNYCKHGILKEKNATADGSPEESDEEDSGFRQVTEYEDKILKELSDPRLRTFMSRVFLKQYDDKLLKKCARLILALTSGAALLSFFPWSDIQKLEDVFNLIKTDKYNRHEHLDTLESFRVQYADIVACACKHYLDDEIADFFLYLLQLTRTMHTTNLPRPSQSQHLLQSSDSVTQLISPHFSDNQPQQIPSHSFDNLQQPTPSQSSDNQPGQIPTHPFHNLQQRTPSPSSENQPRQIPSQSHDSEHHSEYSISPFDPTTGISYYFTAHGGQLRQTPVYSMDGM